MTERERINAAADIQRDYGITVTPDNEILPLIMSIKNLEKNCRLSIQEAANSLPTGRKTYQFGSSAQAFFFGLGRWGLAALVAVAGLVIFLVDTMMHSSAEREYLQTRVAVDKMYGDIQRANNLGYLKDVQVLEDEKGKYFLLEETGGNGKAEAGKNFQLIRDSHHRLLAKIYTVYYK
jgi:hypothetical protein